MKGTQRDRLQSKEVKIHTERQITKQGSKYTHRETERQAIRIHRERDMDIQKDNESKQRCTEEEKVNARARQREGDMNM